MPTRLLYNIPVPESAQTSQGQRQLNRLLSEGTLGTGVDAVRTIAADPDTKLLEARLKGRHALLISRMFEELFGNDSIKFVPYFVRGPETTEEDRYVALEDVNTEPAHPTDKRVHRFDGSMKTKGTRGSHRRALRTNPTTEDNPFGSDSSQEIGIPKRAQKVYWNDLVDGSRDTASPVRTVDGEHDKIEIYDIQNTSIADPVLTYDIPYRDEWPVDTRVWDDYDRQKIDEDDNDDGGSVGTATVGDDSTGSSRRAVQWQRVFSTSHDYVGLPILENDVLRLIFNEDRQKITAARWNESDENYDRVQLGQSDWRLFDVDITRIGVERVDAQIEFEDTSSPRTTHNLNLSLKRGYENGLWLNPDNEGSVPSGLIDRLDSIAATTDEDPASVADLVDQEETDR